MDLEQAIRGRAYFKWLDSGCEHGNADAHWLAAEIELAAEVELAAEAEVLAASMETVAQLMSSSESTQDNEPVVAKSKTKRRAVSQPGSASGGRIQASSAPRKSNKRSSRLAVASLN
jgi:Protein of unknown function (DUF2934)